jgi:hypothetical protein
MNDEFGEEDTGAPLGALFVVVFLMSLCGIIGWVGIEIIKGVFR